MGDDPTFRILVSDNISERGLDLLRATPRMQVTVNTGMSPGELADAVGRYDGMIVRSATKVTAEVLGHPGRLRVIGRAGTGVDNIDLEAAARAGVVVLNTPGGNSVAVAEHSFALLLALARNVVPSNLDLRAGRWERGKHRGVEIAGKTLGVVGLGRIGREVAARARSFRMEVLGHDPLVSDEDVAGCSALRVELDALVARSDFVSLHLPLSPATRHLVDAPMLARFKPGARLINCARGGLVDEQALYEALESGRVAGAALDVFETEPPVDRRLIEHPRVVSTPHLGASTLETQDRVGTEIAEKVRDHLVHGKTRDQAELPR